MDFKEGELFLANDGKFFIDMLLEYNETHKKGNIIGTVQVEYTTQLTNSIYKVGRRAVFGKKDCKKLPYDNPLNRKLYPSRVEYNGQLLPKDLVKELEGV